MIRPPRTTIMTSVKARTSVAGSCPNTTRAASSPAATLPRLEASPERAAELVVNDARNLSPRQSGASHLYKFIRRIIVRQEIHIRTEQDQTTGLLIVPHL